MTALLGNPHAVDSSEDPPTRERRRQRFRAAEQLRAFNTWLFQGQRLGQCGWRRGTRPGLKRTTNGRVHWTGIKTCGSVWACLRCAGKIRAARAAEIDHLAKAHIATGGHCTMLTFTLAHYATDDLAVLWSAMTKAWESMTSGAVYHRDLKARYGILGFIKAVEVTHGRNGWHPHLHVLIFHDTVLSDEDGSLDEFRAVFGARWQRFIGTRLGRQIHYRYGVDATIVRDDDGIGAYVSKIHFELARSDLKTGRPGKGRTPWQIGLDAENTGDAQDTARWCEYVQLTHGKRAISISPAVRDAYPKHQTADQSDEELAQEEQAGEVELNFDNELYDAILHHRAGPLRAIVATALEDGGQPGVIRALAALGRPVYVGLPEPGDNTPVMRFVSTQAWGPLANNSSRTSNGPKAGDGNGQGGLERRNERPLMTNNKEVTR